MSSVRVYLTVTIALFLLLALTIGAAWVNLGPFNISVALAISIAKAALILIFFMHLRRGHPLARIFALTGFFWLGILFVLAMSDYLTR